MTVGLPILARPGALHYFLRRWRAQARRGWDFVSTRQELGLAGVAGFDGVVARDPGPGPGEVLIDNRGAAGPGPVVACDFDRTGRVVVDGDDLLVGPAAAVPDQQV